MSDNLQTVEWAIAHLMAMAGKNTPARIDFNLDTITIEITAPSVAVADRLKTILEES